MGAQAGRGAGAGAGEESRPYLRQLIRDTHIAGQLFKAHFCIAQPKAPPPFHHHQHVSLLDWKVRKGRGRWSWKWRVKVVPSLASSAGSSLLLLFACISAAGGTTWASTVSNRACVCAARLGASINDIPRWQQGGSAGTKQTGRGSSLISLRAMVECMRTCLWTV